MPTMKLPDNDYVRKYEELSSLLELYIQNMDFHNDEGDLRTDIIKYNLHQGVTMVNDVDTYVDKNHKFYNTIARDLMNQISHVYYQLLKFRTEGEIKVLPYFHKPQLKTLWAVFKAPATDPYNWVLVAEGLENRTEARVFLTAYREGADV